MTLIRKITLVSLFAFFSAASISAEAQSNDFGSDPFHSDREIHIGFKIPLGPGSADVKNAPRLALSVRNFQSLSQQDTNWALRPNSRASGLDYFENEVALSLNRSPEFLINGQSIYISELENADLSDGGKIAIGVGAAVVLTAGAFVLYFAKCHSDGEDAKPGCPD